MKCVLLGDVGWQYLYHLGDEAMTEAAILMLEQRGIDQITLVAAQPAVAESFYGKRAVKRFGFSSKWSRDRLETELTRVTRALDEGDSPLHESVKEADAVVIAGGGNMNSDHAYHLYERVALKRLAEHHGKPLMVSSQTIGPMLRDRDKQLVAEIISYATCFGAREATTYKLALDLGGVPGRVVSTMDDAMMLSAQAEDYQYVARLGLSERYVVGSFTSHQGTTGLSDEEYIEKTAKTLDALAIQLDADVALVPHTGSLDVSVRKGDQLSNYALADESESGRLKPLDMMTARQVVALTENAILSISTRYHPTVFGPMMQVPTMSVSLSYYSSVRMRGAMENAGLKKFVVPATSWALVGDVATELVGRTADLKRHMGPISDRRRSEQSAWWDAIVRTIHGSEWDPVGNLTELGQFEPKGEWTNQVEQVTPVFDLFGQEKVWTKWFLQDNRTALADAQQAKARVTELSQQLRNTELANAELRDRAAAAERRKAVRVADSVGRVVRKVVRR